MGSFQGSYAYCHYLRMRITDHTKIVVPVELARYALVLPRDSYSCNGGCIGEERLHSMVGTSPESTAADPGEATRGQSSQTRIKVEKTRKKESDKTQIEFHIELN